MQDDNANIVGRDGVDISKKFNDDGFICPIHALSETEAKALRDDYEEAEYETGSDIERLSLLRSYPHRLLPSFDMLTRNDGLIDAVSSILGENILVWSAPMFIKEANSSQIVSWHQDLTYWRLDNDEEITCWFAISPASKTSGCMQFVAGSHKNQILPHHDTYNSNNLLSRGQEVAVDVNEDDAVYAELKAGAASLHHGLLFHSSGANNSGDRRIGSAIRYISATMKQETGDRPMVTQVKGSKDFGNFNILPSPEGRLLEIEFQRCAADAKLKKRMLF